MTQISPQQQTSRMQLTETRVASARPENKRWVLADTSVPGLVVRIEPSGIKSYFARSRIGRGRSAPWVEIRIANTEAMRLAEARQAARKLLTDMRAGIDPRAPQMGEMPVGALIDLYAKRLEQREVVKRADIIRSLKANLSRQSRRPAGEITRAEIVLIIDQIEADGRPGAAQDFRKHVVALLNWAVGAGLLMASPMAGYRRERSTRAQRIARPKPVFITGEEIRAFWQAAAMSPDPIFVAYLRFLLLTGQRRTETALMRRTDVVGSGDNAYWIIPAEIRKMGDVHKVPLGEFSCRLIRTLPRTSSGLVFPGRNDVPMSGWTKRLAPMKAALSDQHFGFHALRRTFRSGLSELGVSFEIAELMIGHARPDLARRYDHAELWRQRREAQALWERYVVEAVL